jgi:hypothetical protein
LETGITLQMSQRILSSYLLYCIYAPHPIEINPFRSALHLAFVKERDNALNPQLSQDVVAEHKALAWVLLKILKDEGSDVSCCTLFGLPLYTCDIDVVVESFGSFPLSYRIPYPFRCTLRS